MKAIGERWLLLGGSSFVGAALLEQLGDTNCAATFHRHPFPTGNALPLDVLDPAAVEERIDCLRPTTIIDSTLLDRSNRVAPALAVRHLLLALEKTRCTAHVVYLSTDAVFAGCRRGPHDEKMPPLPATAYGEGKLAAERLLQQRRPDCCVLRTALVHGRVRRPGAERREWDARSQQILTEAGQGPVRAFIDQWRSPTFVADIAAATLWAATERLAGLWHAAGPERLSRWEITDTFLRFILGTKGGAEPSSLLIEDEARYSGRDTSLVSTRFEQRWGHRFRSLSESLLLLRAELDPETHRTSTGAT